MSTEIAMVRDAARARRAQAGYRRAFGTVIVALTVATLALAALGAVRGPAIRDASVNTAAAVERSGQRLVIDTDQPIEPVVDADVRVTPEAPVTVASDGSRITVRFDSVLRYADEYTVEVDARGTATGAASTLRHTFTTDDALVYSLLRADGEDQILRASVAGTHSTEPVVSADHIQEYAVARDILVYVTTDQAGIPSLQLRVPDDPQSYEMPLPDAGGMRALQAATSELLVGFLTDDGSAEGVLHIVDLEDASWTPRPIRDAAGDDLVLRDWLWVPGTTSVVMQTADRELLLVDVLGDTAPQLLGTHTELRGFLPGTVKLVVADPTAGTIIDLATGQIEALDLPPIDIDPDLYPVGFLLTSSTSSIEAFTDLLGPADAPRSVVVRVDPSGTHELYRPASASARVGEICLSPNGQYVAVEVIPAGSPSDNDPYVPGWEGTTTYFVDAVTGDTSRGLPGMHSSWCG
jgi:hypothetical protein